MNKFDNIRNSLNTAMDQTAAHIFCNMLDGDTMRVTVMLGLINEEYIVLSYSDIENDSLRFKVVKVSFDSVDVIGNNLWEVAGLFSFAENVVSFFIGRGAFVYKRFIMRPNEDGGDEEIPF